MAASRALVIVECDEYLELTGRARMQASLEVRLLAAARADNLCATHALLTRLLTSSHPVEDPDREREAAVGDQERDENAALFPVVGGTEGFVGYDPRTDRSGESGCRSEDSGERPPATAKRVLVPISCSPKLVATGRITNRIAHAHAATRAPIIVRNTRDFRLICAS